MTSKHKCDTLNLPQNRAAIINASILNFEGFGFVLPVYKENYRLFLEHSQPFIRLFLEQNYTRFRGVICGFCRMA
nr:MAG TPA: hypothetical protein [Caudoviricetes sp.]